MAFREEKRKFERLNILTDVSFTREDSPDARALSVTKNISAGGVCFIAYEQPQEGDLLNLKIYLPEQSKPVIALGKVAWVREFVIGDPVEGRRFDVGVEFIKISDEDFNKIQKYKFSHND
jgi:c-di-GMP-binding flagellar brake protein YcgR